MKSGTIAFPIADGVEDLEFYVTKMRLEEAGHLPLFHEYGSGGHGGAGNSAEMARRTAMGYSFLRETIMKA